MRLILEAFLSVCVLRVLDKKLSLNDLVYFQRRNVIIPVIESDGN